MIVLVGGPGLCTAGGLIGPGPLARLGLLLPRRPSQPLGKRAYFVVRS
jgi:hypothetical protein